MLLAEYVAFGPGDQLVKQGEKVEMLLLMISGSACVEVNGKAIAYCNKGDFIGEVSFISGNPASASVIATEKLRCVRWNQADLRKFLVRELEIARPLNRILGNNIINKLTA
jgi:CRP-like cAMP-binding protein